MRYLLFGLICHHVHYAIGSSAECHTLCTLSSPKQLCMATREAAPLIRGAERQWLLWHYLLQDTHCGQSNFKRSTHLFIWLDLSPCALFDRIFLLRTIKDWGPRLLTLYYYYCKAAFLQNEHAGNCLLLLHVAPPLTFTQTSVPKCCHEQNMPHPSCN